MNLLAVSPALVRSRIRVQGTVQGVGFRPFVYRLAGELGLAGFVLNDSRGVLIEVEGPVADVDRLIARLGDEAPPLAVLERVEVERCPSLGEAGFVIRQSPHDGEPAACVTPDSATCADCLRELFDPADRRFRYPFISCTNCGPRFTIVMGVPYDRPLTTMAGFTMCPECRREYEDPADRRFHAQPNACPRCGPSVKLVDGCGRPGSASGDPIAAAVQALRSGAIVAIKGLGGYHLACLAEDDRAVARLRARKHREEKPFALMAPDLRAAESLVTLDEAGRELLLSGARPIVLAPRRASAPVAGAVAPASPELGVMLPYSPLHHLLVRDLGSTLVLTSGNLSDEPIAYRDADALKRLSAIVDLFLVHDRPIQTRTDDSVVRRVTIDGTRATSFLRRSRGYVPDALPMPAGGSSRPLLACGAELKNTFCVSKEGRAWISHHIGDLENLETLESFTEGIEHFQRLFAVTPELVAHDLHPEYLSSKWALAQDGVELIGVQHHHAHLAAVLAEHDERGHAVAAIFDGAGYGLDGTLWGGELLVGDLAGFRRVGSLHPVTLPGGAQAIRQPWRMTCAWLQEAFGEAQGVPGFLRGAVGTERWDAVARLARTPLAPVTTSAGRLFDAVAGLCGIRAEVRYEGQAAIELEAICDVNERGEYPLPVGLQEGFLTLDPRPTLRAAAADVADGEPSSRIAARFHTGLARAVVQACSRLAAEHDTGTVVLSGGVFANRRLLDAASRGLSGQGLRVLTALRLPAGDGGISYGQAAVAAARAGAGAGGGGGC